MTARDGFTRGYGPARARPRQGGAACDGAGRRRRAAWLPGREQSRSRV